jgi:hypothetical protein
MYISNKALLFELYTSSNRVQIVDSLTPTAIHMTNESQPAAPHGETAPVRATKTPMSLS